MGDRDLVVSIRGVEKGYHSLRPLRVERLDLRRGEAVALLGLDRAAAEVLVSLVTAATLPDRGDIDVFGVPTREITNADAWVGVLDRFGILSDRVVVLDDLTVEQNLALPLSLELHDLPADVRRKAARLAAECGIDPSLLPQPMGRATPDTSTRVRLAKALALDPDVLLAEHPTASLSDADVAKLAADLSAIAAARRLAMLLLTANTAFAGAAARDRVLMLAPATGRLAPVSWWRRWSGR